MIEYNVNEKNRVIAGVCARGGDYFNIDPAIFRIFFLMLAIFWGIGIWVYLLVAVVLPAEKNKKNENNS